MTQEEQQQRRIQFLQDAAHLLAVSSPAAAAFMGRARDRVIEDAGLALAPKEYEASRRDICGACGNVMIPGLSCRVSTRSKPKSKGVGRRCNHKKEATTTPEPRSASETEVMYQCLRCHRETTQTLPPKPRRQTSKSRAHTEPQPTKQVKMHNNGTDGGISKTSNSTSKQRQKARKGGLQAMLEKNKSQSSGSGGFDLMDFAM
ncbi:hypothetical protein NX059_006964 [Plenodomus lindquistii]|nr:hypothetical protein NX059_006964 [Plenodomus lindquistii]